MASDGEISCANDPNFAVIYSFLKTFGKLYGLDVPTLTKLQELIENTQEVLDPLKELHLRLLRRAHKTVASNRWERFMIKFCHQQGHHQEAWEIERFSYKKASTQVKLKVLKLLLEYQFTCHPKFKNAVNAISCKELRLDPIGRDKNGCVYWLQVDHEANLCLYKEDQDEETWQLVARTREELVKVISQLKSGEEVCPLFATNTNVNEDSNSAEIPPQLESNKSEVEEENEEEFLSPESESEHEPDEQKNEEEPPLDKEESKPEGPSGDTTEKVEEEVERKEVAENSEPVSETPDEQETVDTTEKEDIAEQPNSPQKEEPLESTDEVEKEPVTSVDKESTDEQKPEEDKEEASKEQPDEEVGEAIEEPLMLVTGEGNGADCDSSYIIGEEISEPVMFFYGEGWGYDNDTGNPDTIEQAQSPEENSTEENGGEECINGEHPHELSNSSNKNNVVKNVKLKSSLPSVTKRSLKNQSNDATEVLNTDSKKHCVRDVDQSDGSNSTKHTENELKREASVNDKSTTDSESPQKNNAKKGRGKVKKKSNLARNIKLNTSTEVVNSETDNCHDSKTSIIEKRKSSVSSVDQDDTVNTENEKEKSPDKELKVEDPLPPKKLRLETTPESDVNTHSNETGDSVENSETKKDSLNNVESNPIEQRKKIKANKGKFKRKKIVKKDDENVDNSDKEANDNGKKECKSLKRSLLDATMSDKNKSESQSESEDDEPITSGKRLKIKPKKISTSTRKKVEAKLLEKHSSDESEEETLYSIAGKKSTKKLVKKKIKVKDKGKSNDKGKSHDKGKSSKDRGRASDDSDVAPVRQSRRIAQMKIKEEADRRHLEEVALRELKKIHKKKNKEEEAEEEEWRASGASSSEGERRRRRSSWRSDHSTGPEPDSDSDEPLFDMPDEPQLVFDKSDHEFSPESDLESGEPVEPLKRARTLQEGKEDADGFCKRCGSGEQPEWILLCDKCDAGYHASCLKPVLFVVPEGDWFCPPCNHDMLIASLEAELVKYDELLVTVEAERERKKLEQPEPKSEKESEDEKEERQGDDDDDDKSSDGSASSEWSSDASSGGVYRLRARRQLPVSYRAQEYDRLISSAIKEEYVEATTSAGNQGRGKDISTIIEAAEEEKMKAEREALEQGKPIERKTKKKQRRKPRKLNSLEVPSEDDDETDEDFKDTGALSMDSSSEDISSSADGGSSSDSRSSDSLPIRRTCRTDKKERPKLAESSPEVKKKKKGVLEDSSSESAGAKEWSSKSKSKKSRPPKTKRRDKSKKSRKRSALTQYDAQGNVIRARVTYGGLSGDDDNDWSPKHRTRQKKINYTEMPNTESEDEMHKSSGKHMPDSSDEYKIDTDASTDSDDERAKRKKPEDEDSEQTSEEKRKALSDLIRKTAVVPLEKLPEDVTKAKTEELQAHLNAQAAAMNARPSRGRGSRGGRGSSADCRTPRGRGRGADPTSDDALAKLIGVKIKDLRTDGSPMKPNQVEREKKRQEREAKRAEREAKKVERLQKKEEKEKMKEQKAKEREEKRLARLAMQETKRIKKEKMEFPVGQVPYGSPPPHGYAGPRMPNDFHEQPRFPATPRLQVRAELRGVLSADERARPDHAAALREVAGSPQPFKPITEEPSIITRMPHMINQQYRGPMMYPGGGSYGPRAANMSMYPLHPALGPSRQYPPYYPHHPAHPAHPAYSRPPYSAPARHPMPPGHGPPGHGPPGHGPPGHGPPGHGPPGHAPPGHGPPGHGPPGHGPPGHGPPPSGHGSMPPGHGPPVSSHGPPGHVPSPPGHGPPPHGPPHPGHGPLGLHRPHAPGPPGAMPPASSPHGMPSPAPLGMSRPPAPRAAPSPAARRTPPAELDPAVRIKAEVKTEQPEYHSPAASPARDPSPTPPRDEPPRHPKIKVTENKDRRPRYPLGPYAPQYGPYGPYAPPPPAPAERGAAAGPRGPPLQHPAQPRGAGGGRGLPAAAPARHAAAGVRAGAQRPRQSGRAAAIRAALPRCVPHVAGRTVTSRRLYASRWASALR
ncbi:remodeling and spacing factor 1 isoform X3 [Helicoverpa armigera]|uniref:remodeling and spacing factor 1 isoform X3 n=1 Tax=Helicoverpa armigera TaxID=29058 RepID=UPI003083AF5B